MICVLPAQTERGWAEQANVDAMENEVLKRLELCEHAQDRGQRRMESTLGAEVSRLLGLQESFMSASRSLAEEGSNRLEAELLSKIDDRCLEIEKQLDSEKRYGRASAQRLREEVESMLQRASWGQTRLLGERSETTDQVWRPKMPEPEPEPEPQPQPQPPVQEQEQKQEQKQEPQPRPASQRQQQPQSPLLLQRKAELEKMPALKLKATAKRVGVAPIAIGHSPRTKEETIEAVLAKEGLRDPRGP